MSRVSKITHKNKEIVFVDYSNIKKVEEMLEVLHEFNEMIVKDNKKYVFCADYTDSFTTPKYMAAARSFLDETGHLIEKGSFLGITGAKKVLLSGIIRVFRLNFKAFESRETAFDYLLEA